MSRVRSMPGDGRRVQLRADGAADLGQHCIACHQGNVKDPDIEEAVGIAIDGRGCSRRRVAGQRDFTRSYFALTARASVRRW